MYGQTKTERECTVCHSIVIQYQPYSMLTLPVPNANLIVIPVILYTVPQEIKMVVEDICDQNNNADKDFFNIKLDKFMNTEVIGGTESKSISMPDTT